MCDQDRLFTGWIDTVGLEHSTLVYAKVEQVIFGVIVKNLPNELF